MRALIVTLPLRLGLVLTLAASGCGGSQVRDKDGSVTVEPEPVPDPTPEPTPDPNPGATTPPGADAGAPDPDGPASPPGPGPDTAPPPGPTPDTAPQPGPDPDGAAPGPDPDTGPPAAPPPDAAPEPPRTSCGGVTCPALFQLLDGCRPMGSCMLNAVAPIPLTFCYANGIKVVGESIVPPNLVGLVKRPDGSDCYRARVFQNTGSPDQNVVWETPAGVPVASGVFDSAGAGTITCDEATTALTDPACVSIPSPQGCTPGFCF
jgi:hypothetical protein